MSLEAINKFLKQKPFVPFEVVLSSGATYRITHPEVAVANKGLLVIAYPESETADVCALLHITAIHFLEAAESSAAS
jgi:hypothetical protein